MEIRDIEVNEAGVHEFQVSLTYKGTEYYIEGMSEVNHSFFYNTDDRGTIKDYDIEIELHLDDIYSGLDAEYQHDDEELTEALKMALIDKIYE